MQNKNLPNKLTFEKVNENVYKVFDKQNRHIAYIKKIMLGGYFYWVMSPIPCVENGQLFYNLCYTKRQLDEMSTFISQKYGEYIRERKKFKKEDTLKRNEGF